MCGCKSPFKSELPLIRTLFSTKIRMKKKISDIDAHSLYDYSDKQFIITTIDDDPNNLQDVMIRKMSDYLGEYDDKTLEEMLKIEDNNKKQAEERYNDSCSKLFNILTATGTLVLVTIGILTLINANLLLSDTMSHLLWILLLISSVLSLLLSFHVYRQTIEFGHSTYRYYRKYTNNYRFSIISSIVEARLTSLDFLLANNYKHRVASFSTTITMGIIFLETFCIILICL